MNCHRPLVDSLPLAATSYVAPDKSCHREGSCRKSRFHSCLGDSLGSLFDVFDVQGSLRLGDDPDCSSKFGYQAWPWPEPLVTDDAFALSDYNFDAMATDCGLPSWKNTPLALDPELDECTTSMPTEKSVPGKFPGRFREVGRVSRSPSSTSSDPSDDNMWREKSSPDSDYRSSTRPTTRPSKWVKKNKSGVSKAAAHNLIEKKYRSNLNDRMLALRDTIPRLRMMAEKAADDSESQEPSRKLNKVGVSGALRARCPITWGPSVLTAQIGQAYILTEARDYIRYLQKRNEALADKEKDLEARVRAFQMLARSRRNKTWPVNDE